MRQDTVLRWGRAGSGVSLTLTPSNLNDGKRVALPTLRRKDKAPSPCILHHAFCARIYMRMTSRFIMDDHTRLPWRFAREYRSVLAQR